MHGSVPLSEMQAVPRLSGWLVEFYSRFSIFRDIREPKALADLGNGLCFTSGNFIEQSRLLSQGVSH